MLPPLHVAHAGHGPRCVLVHGSATDHATWTLQIASRLTEQLRLVAYDRRGAGRSPLPAGVEWLTVEEHARDLADVIEAEDGAALLVGSSFGAAVVLEAARRFPHLVHAAVLLEPPLPPADDAPDAQGELVAALEKVAAEHGPGVAAERFLRTVLGDAGWDSLPRPFQERTRAAWSQIRGDCRALAAYRVRYAELGAIHIPVLLLGGDQSAPYFRATLEALTRNLARAELDTVAHAGHMLHAEAPRGFHERLLRFAAAHGLLPR